LTSPLTTGLGADGDGTASAPAFGDTRSKLGAPYSVEGEEPLDPGGN